MARACVTFSVTVVTVSRVGITLAVTVSGCSCVTAVRCCVTFVTVPALR